MRRNPPWPIGVLRMHRRFRRDSGFFEALRYEIQIEAVDILPRGRANATRLARADDYIDGLLCGNYSFWVVPRARFVVSAKLLHVGRSRRCSAGK
jgi:hypothetical protein